MIGGWKASGAWLKSWAVTVNSAPLFCVSLSFCGQWSQITTWTQLPWWLSRERISLQCRRLRFSPRVRKVPWRRKWQPTPVFLPGKIPWTEEPGGLQSMGSQELDTTERLNRQCHLDSVSFIHSRRLEKSQHLAGTLEPFSSSPFFLFHPLFLGEMALNSSFKLSCQSN